MTTEWKFFFLFHKDYLLMLKYENNFYIINTQINLLTLIFLINYHTTEMFHYFKILCAFFSI